MAKRGITDEEIGLIKAMLARGMKNKDIQFFFNRPDRAVNSGRITQIGQGVYSDSNTISAASDDVLQAFLAAHEPTPVSAVVSVPAVAPVVKAAEGPLAESVLMAMFARESDGTWRLVLGESDCHECKANFGFRHTGPWLRAVAALANNRGGYVLFGVHDKDVERKTGRDQSYMVTGLAGEDFFAADPGEISKRIKATFDPTPRVQIGTMTIEGKRVGVFHVEAHPSRPVIATRSEGDKINEGDIFFRYPGQSARIKYSDLRALLDDRDRQVRKEVLPLVERLLYLGPRRAMIADLEAGALTDGERSIYIDHKLLNQIEFIREGQFAEADGAPTLRLVGDVKVVDALEVSRRGVVTNADLVGAFLSQNAVLDPLEYIRWAVEGSRTDWMPICYFARAAGLEPQGLMDFVSRCSATPGRKAVFVERASGKRSAFRKPGVAQRELVHRIHVGPMPAVASEHDAVVVAGAIMGLEGRPSAPLPDLLKLLTDCADATSNDSKGSATSLVRRAVCRVDELFFAM